MAQKQTLDISTLSDQLYACIGLLDTQARRSAWILGAFLIFGAVLEAVSLSFILVFIKAVSNLSSIDSLFLNTPILEDILPPVGSDSLVLLCTAFIGVFLVSFGGLIVKSFETQDPWQILFWRQLFFAITIFIFLLLKYKKILLNQFTNQD